MLVTKTACAGTLPKPLQFLVLSLVGPRTVLLFFLVMTQLLMRLVGNFLCQNSSYLLLHKLQLWGGVLQCTFPETARSEAEAGEGKLALLAREELGGYSPKMLRKTGPNTVETVPFSCTFLRQTFTHFQTYIGVDS